MVVQQEPICNSICQTIVLLVVYRLWRLPRIRFEAVPKVVFATDVGRSEWKPPHALADRQLLMATLLVVFGTSGEFWRWSDDKYSYNCILQWAKFVPSKHSTQQSFVKFPLCKICYT